MIAFVGPSSTEGSLLKGTSDDPSSGPLPLTLEKRLEILQKWQKQQTLYTEEAREFILKSGFSRDQPEKVSSVGPSSTEGSLLKGTSDDPSSGPLPLTLEKRLEILHKWQKQHTLYTEEAREFILKSSFSRDQPEKVSSIGPSSTEGSLLKGTSDDPSSGPLPLTLEKRLKILQKWQKQQTLYTEEAREFILKSGFRRDKQKKDYPFCPSDVEDTDSALVQQQDTDTDSALVQGQDTDTDSALVQQQEQASGQSARQPVSASLLDQTSISSSFLRSSQGLWYCNECKKDMPTTSKPRHMESILHLASVAAMKEQASGQSARQPVSASLSDQTSISSSGLPSSQGLWYGSVFKKDMPTTSKPRRLESILRLASVTAKKDKWTCDVCKTEILMKSKRRHMKSKAHLDKVAAMKDPVKLSKLKKNDADKEIVRLLIEALHVSEGCGRSIIGTHALAAKEHVTSSVFTILHENKEIGTAFVLNSLGDPLMLTAGHVIDGIDKETVLETEGRYCLPASPVGISSIADVGVLRPKGILFQTFPCVRPFPIDLGTETSTHIYVVGFMSGNRIRQIEKCLVLPSRDNDDGTIRFQSKLFSEGSFGSPCLVRKNGQYVVKGMLIGKEKGTDTPYELIAITFRCVWKQLGLP